MVVPHRHRHHARRPQDARHLAQAHRRRPGRTGQPGARRVVHQAGLLEQGQRVRPDLRQRRQQPGEPQAPDDTWKVRLIEEDFHRLMFDTEGV